MSDQPTPEEWERAIAGYQESYRQLIRLGTHLIETGRDLAEMQSIVEGLTERQAKSLLKAQVALDAADYASSRRRAKLN